MALPKLPMWRLWAILTRLKLALEHYAPAHIVLAHRFKSIHGRPINWRHPTLFNEKICWLMLYDRQPIKARLADKYAVREFVRERVGAQYLNELYGIWDDADAVNFDSLPSTFILKATHGSEMIILCRDRATFDEAATRRKMAEWLCTDYARQHREWVYRDVRRRIIAEALLDDGSGDLPDYKFFCFDGEPRLIQVDVTRFTDHRRELFTPDWRHVTEYTRRFPPSGRVIPRPSNLTDMLGCAARLAVGFPFVRVDLYSVKGRTVFGEMTWFPGAGYEAFAPLSAEIFWGKALRLPTDR